MSILHRGFLTIALAGLTVVAPRARGAEPFAVTVERGAAVKMRDGAVLRADIYRPRTEGSFPVLLERTPYDKNNSSGFGLRAAAQGYVVIVQDVRGRYTSDGEWYPFKHESNDGFDTVEWAATLPYSHGRGGNVWWFVRRCDADAGRRRASATPFWNLSRRHRQ